MAEVPPPAPLLQTLVAEVYGPDSDAPAPGRAQRALFTPRPRWSTSTVCGVSALQGDPHRRQGEGCRRHHRRQRAWTLRVAVAGESVGRLHVPMTKRMSTSCSTCPDGAVTDRGSSVPQLLTDAGNPCSAQRAGPRHEHREDRTSPRNLMPSSTSPVTSRERRESGLRHLPDEPGLARSADPVAITTPASRPAMHDRRSSGTGSGTSRSSCSATSAGRWRSSSSSSTACWWAGFAPS